MLEPRGWRLRATATVSLFALLAWQSLANEPIVLTDGHVATLADLRRLNADQLQQLYASACPGAQPVGFARGQVLCRANTRMPRMKTRLSNFIWKGKHFNEHGEFINQWIAFHAFHSQVAVGPSFYDGRPCLVLEYPENTPYFGKMRDEAREVAPGVYLAMVFDRNPPYTFQGFIGFELEAKHKKLSLRR